MAESGPEGFADFVSARYSALARSAFLLTGDRGLAEDLVQSALVAALRSWGRLRAPEAAESYVRTTMVRLAGKAARRRWRQELPTADPESDQLAVDPDRAGALDLHAGLRTLPWEQRAVLVLRFFDDLSERETAARLGCRVGTVKSRTSRALAALRESGLLDTEVHDG